MEKYRAKHISAYAAFLQRASAQKAFVPEPARLPFSESGLPAENTATGYLHTHIQGVAFRNRGGKKAERRTIQ